MSGKDFEEFIAEWLKKCGYSTKVTKDSHDYGADVIAKKDEISYAIQCKYWQNSVDVETSSKFIKQAKELAQANRILLWDGEYIKSKIMEEDS